MGVTLVLHIQTKINKNSWIINSGTTYAHFLKIIYAINFIRGSMISHSEIGYKFASKISLLQVLK